MTLGSQLSAISYQYGDCVAFQLSEGWFSVISCYTKSKK